MTFKSISKRFGSKDKNDNPIVTMRLKNLRQSRQVPGPGTYEIISEFGTYNNKLRSNKSFEK